LQHACREPTSVEFGTRTPITETYLVQEQGRKAVGPVQTNLLGPARNVNNLTLRGRCRAEETLIRINGLLEKVAAEKTVLFRDLHVQASGGHVVVEGSS